MLYIKKRRFTQILVLYMFFTPFMLNILQEFLHVPSLIKYTLDIAWFAALIAMIVVKKQTVHKKILPFLLLVGVYAMFVLIAYLFNYQSVFYFLWGIRNNMRFYVAFFAAIYFLDKDDISFCLNAIDLLFVLHVLVTFFQFFILGYKWDYLGGIFGVQRGCNSNSLVLLIVVCIKSLLKYMNGKEALLPCLAKCGLSLVIAAMSELKAFFLIFVCIVVLAALVTKFSMKKVLITVASALAIVVAGQIFVAIWDTDFVLNAERLQELLFSENYSSTEDLGRAVAIPVLSESFLVDTSSKLFGLGLGNCDTSAFAICNTPFFQTYSYLNYNWLSSAFAFLETGYLGMTILLSFFVLVFILAMRIRKSGTAEELHCQISMVLSAICLILFFYNASLRMEIGYFTYLMLALPFVQKSEECA